MRRLRLTVCALALIACGAAPASGGTLDGLTDEQIAARFAPRLVLHADERYAPTSADELLALGAVLVGRAGAVVQPAPLTPAALPVGNSCVGGLPCAYALRLGCGLVAARPCPAPAGTPPLIYARVVRRHPATGSPPAWLANPNLAMPFPKLEVVVQYWLYSLIDDWRSTPRSVTLPGGRTFALPTVRQHHEGDWEAITVGMSADRPLFVDWSAHCAGEWRRFTGATLVADPGDTPTHPVSWVALGSHANLPAGVNERPRWWRCDPRVATFVHRRVESTIGPVATAAIGSHLDDALGIYDRAGTGAPQAYPVALVNRLMWPMSFPGIWGGREQMEVGRAKRALGWSPPTPPLQKLWRDPLATIFADAGRSRG
ncbi:MAG: Vacuolar protein sorting-associated protein 62 [Gaiellales bacterium]|jgi:hypothetical protein|nr:Vacuolar protein sorting-associated protein 62 [Gaiellales bacterium]